MGPEIVGPPPDIDGPPQTVARSNRGIAARPGEAV